MRYSFQGVAVDTSLGIVAGATVTVYEADTLTPATIYAAKTGGSAIVGSYVTADENGRWIFYVEDSDYAFMSMFDLKFSAPGMDTTWWYDVR